MHLLCSLFKDRWIITHNIIRYVTNVFAWESEHVVWRKYDFYMIYEESNDTFVCREFHYESIFTWYMKKVTIHLYVRSFIMSWFLHYIWRKKWYVYMSRVSLWVDFYMIYEESNDMFVCQESHYESIFTWYMMKVMIRLYVKSFIMSRFLHDIKG